MNRIIYAIALTGALIGTVAGSLPVNAMMNSKGDGGRDRSPPPAPARHKTPDSKSAGCRIETITVPGPYGGTSERRVYRCG